MSSERSPSPDFQALLRALRDAPTAPDAEAAADILARAVSNAGLNYLNDGAVLSTLTTYATNKKSGYERESAAVGIDALATTIGPACLPLLLPICPTLFVLLADKGDVVRSASTKALRAIFAHIPIEGYEAVTDVLSKEISGGSGKWQAKVACLRELARLVDLRGEDGKEEIARMLVTLLPVVEHAMHDTKQEISNAAKKTATTLCSTLPNPDLRPHIPLLVSSMAAPTEVPNTIKALSNTTFVAEVTSPSLAILVPLLARGLNDRSMEVQRRTVVVLENICKLVRDPVVAARYLSGLVDGVEKIMTSASFPEVRAFAASAHATLLAAGASSTEPPPARVDSAAQAVSAKFSLLSLLPDSLLVPSPNNPSSPPTPFHPLLATTIDFTARLLVVLLQRKQFGDIEKWERAIGAFLDPWLRSTTGGIDIAAGKKFAEKARLHFWALEKAKTAPINGVNSDAPEVVLCDTLFSLAYGALVLLSHTTLRLIRGRRYGICAGNGAGKSTLLRALRDGKVENFPPQEEVRAVMVEHSLQGEDATLPIIDFIASDKQLAGVSRSDIKSQLADVGFDEDRQAQVVGTLSGGWKMKLELARAMLYKADLLMLDEPTNHLDQNSVKWLEDYLTSQKNMTVLIVSHDSSFLDNVTTDVIHYEQKKLVYYPGNLSNFVMHVPSAKSYYTLAATSVKFSFPPPGSLMGVRSNTRAILKLVKCTFAYPGRDKPSLYDVSCALSLSSRVGIVGPNGAGKSTLIKLLTGEMAPQVGTVYKHPSLRVGYVSQHSTHHIERHLEKTPIAYIQWRYQDGHDREILEKVTRVLTEEDKVMMEQPFIGKNGEKRKIELIMGRQKLKKSFQYEIKWKGLDHRFNTWVPRDVLLEKGFTKLVQQFDDLESSREGAGRRETSLNIIRKHLEEVGLDGDIAQYNEMGSLSGGQKVKVVIASALWNNPQVLVLDEPTNFLDREALGGLAVAIRDWGGAVLIISHNQEFIGALCPEIWNLDGGYMTHKGKVAVVEDAFADSKSSKPSSTRTSAAVTPIPSAAATPAGSGTESSKPVGDLKLAKKKKLTRNQVKAQEERRKARKLHWLTFGGPRPEDTDEDE